jgi:hypothetical protein
MVRGLWACNIPGRPLINNPTPNDVPMDNRSKPHEAVVDRTVYNWVDNVRSHSSLYTRKPTDHDVRATLFRD